MTDKRPLTFALGTVGGTGAELSATTLSTLNRTGLRFKEEGKIDLPLAETTTFCYWALIGPMSFWLNLRDD